RVSLVLLCCTYSSILFFCFFLSLPLSPPSSTLFPYTTLFRSAFPQTSLCATGMPARTLTMAHNLPQTLFSGRLCAIVKVRAGIRSEEHTSELQSRGHLVCRLLLEKKK